MRRERGTGFALRTWPLREADLIVSLYTLEHGKVRGVARGAVRPKSRWAGALNPMTEIAVQWNEREGEELVSLSDCAIVRSPYRREADLARSWSLAFIAEIMDATAPAHDADETAYRLLRAAMDAVEADVAAVTVARYVQAWILRLAGVLPDARACVACGAAILRDGGAWHWSLHGIACSRCHGGHEGVTLQAADLALLDAWQRQAPTQLPAADPTSLRRLSVLLGQVTRELMGGRQLRSERFLDEALRLA